MKVLCLNFTPDLSYFTKRGLNLEVTLGTCPDKFTEKLAVKGAIDGDGSSVDIYTPDVEQYLNDTYKTFLYDIILIGWNPANYDSLMNHTGGLSTTFPLKSGTLYGTIRVDASFNTYVIHELHHLLVYTIRRKGTWINDYMDTDVNGKPYFHNNDPEFPGGNYEQTWNQIKPYLSILNKTNMQPYPYKYFKVGEIVGLKTELVQLLDKARGIAGVPFKITSGLRTSSNNELVGGVSDSSHLTGEGVDLASADGATTYKIVTALLQVGFNRIGMYGDGHVHCDISKTLPQNVIWTK